MDIERKEQALGVLEGQGSCADESSEPTAPSERDVSLWRRFRNWKTLLSFAVAFGIVTYLVLRMDVDLGRTLEHISHANPWWFLLAIFSYYLSFPVRAIRWRLLLRNVGFKEQVCRLPSLGGLVEIIMLSWFANCIIPAKLGDAYRGYLLKREIGVSFSTTMGSVLAERICDMLVLFTLLVLAGLQMFRGKVPPEVLSIFVVGAVLVAIIIAVLVVIKLFRPHFERFLPQRFRPVYGRFAEATILSFQKLPALIALSGVVWALEAGRFWAVCQSLNIQGVGISVVFFIALASSLLTTLPITPAGLGLVESAVVAVLILLGNLGILQGISAELATSVAILDRSIGYWSVVAVGLVLFLITKRK